METENRDPSPVRLSLSDRITLNQLMALVRTGREIILTEDEQPVARLIPVAPAGGRRIAGLSPGAIRTSPDFDEPLPDAFWIGKVPLPESHRVELERRLAEAAANPEAAIPWDEVRARLRAGRDPGTCRDHD